MVGFEIYNTLETRYHHYNIMQRMRFTLILIVYGRYRFGLRIHLFHFVFLQIKWVSLFGPKPIKYTIILLTFIARGTSSWKPNPQLKPQNLPLYEYRYRIKYAVYFGRFFSTREILGKIVRYVNFFTRYPSTVRILAR